MSGVLLIFWQVVIDNNYYYDYGVQSQPKHDDAPRSQALVCDCIICVQINRSRKVFLHTSVCHPCDVHRIHLHQPRHVNCGTDFRRLRFGSHFFVTLLSECTMCNSRHETARAGHGMATRRRSLYRHLLLACVGDCYNSRMRLTLHTFAVELHAITCDL